LEEMNNTHPEVGKFKIEKLRDKFVCLKKEYFAYKKVFTYKKAKSRTGQKKS
jgi:hypothetical protein